MLFSSKSLNCKCKTVRLNVPLNFLTSNQFNFLKVIAKEGVVEQPQSNAFIQKHKLPSASSNKKALEVLLEKELVYRTPQGYIIYDRFLALWLQRQFY